MSNRGTIEIVWQADSNTEEWGRDTKEKEKKKENKWF